MGTEQRVFCDTNFLLDVFDAQRKRHDDAVALLWYCEQMPESAKLIASITSFKDAYYILSRLYRNEALARKSIEDIMGQYVHPADMHSAYGQEALNSNEPDFEDGLIRSCAEHAGADVIITSDENAFTNSKIPSITAAEYLSSVGFDYDAILY